MGKQPQPTHSDFTVGPRSDDIGSAPQYHVQMIAHHGVSEAVDPENACQELKAIADPLPAVLVGLSRVGILAAQKSTSNATLHAVQHLKFCGIDRFVSSSARHEPISLSKTHTRRKLPPHGGSGKTNYWVSPFILTSSCLGKLDLGRSSRGVIVFACGSQIVE